MQGVGVGVGVGGNSKMGQEGSISCFAKKIRPNGLLFIKL